MNNHGGKREGAGRKKKDAAGKQNSLTIKVSEDIKEKYSQLIKLENISGNKTDRRKYFSDLIEKLYEEKYNQFVKKRENFYYYVNEIVKAYPNFVLNQLKRCYPFFKNSADSEKRKDEIAKVLGKISGFKYYLAHSKNKDALESLMNSLSDEEKAELRRITGEIEIKLFSLPDYCKENRYEDWRSMMREFLDKVRHTSIYDL